MSYIEKLEKWYREFSDDLENAFPNMKGYVAHNNIKIMIEKIKQQHQQLEDKDKRIEELEQALNDIIEYETLGKTLPHVDSHVQKIARQALNK